jgi:hypothetical protein
MPGKQGMVPIVHDWHTDILLDTQAQVDVRDAVTGAAYSQQGSVNDIRDEAQSPLEEIVEREEEGGEETSGTAAVDPLPPAQVKHGPRQSHYRPPAIIVSIRMRHNSVFWKR